VHDGVRRDSILNVIQNNAMPCLPVSELIVCGWDEVFILDRDTRKEGMPAKIWSWRAAGRSDLPGEHQALFNTTDECKPFDHGQKILITSSGGAVAYVDRQQDRVLFWGRPPNAHSADLLPGNRIAVAASHDPHGGGDRVLVFDLARPDQVLWSEPLAWAHGVVWDEARQILWTLGDDCIRIFKLVDWDTANPRLAVISSHPLPDTGGHDFYTVPDSPFLFVTTSRHVWLFDCDTKTFQPHPGLADKAGVKSVCQHPDTKQVVYVQGDGDYWWSEKLHFLAPDDVLHIPGEHFYKARWNVRIE
jgi:hypothetical protein